MNTKLTSYEKAGIEARLQVAKAFGLSNPMNESKNPNSKWFEFWCGSYRVGTWANNRKRAIDNCCTHKIQPMPTNYNDRMKVSTSTIVVI